MFRNESCTYCQNGEYHYFHHFMVDFETDPAVIARRAKQVAYGFRTIEHQTISYIPKNERPLQCPKTPPIHQKCSRRDFDAQVKRWRKRLHTWTKSKTKIDLEISGKSRVKLEKGKIAEKSDWWKWI